ncbi:MAG TPA: hypothetical protein VD735_06205 [Candidatus Saccharimonadales bacterium]|nr:hypothetical protein [Candidatus Saccharimonadales bacterium]
MKLFNKYPVLTSLTAVGLAGSIALGATRPWESPAAPTPAPASAAPETPTPEASYDFEAAEKERRYIQARNKRLAKEYYVDAMKDPAAKAIVRRIGSLSFDDQMDATLSRICAGRQAAYDQWTSGYGYGRVGRTLEELEGWTSYRIAQEHGDWTMNEGLQLPDYAEGEARERCPEAFAPIPSR